mgnify:CR=1 FL=1
MTAQGRKPYESSEAAERPYIPGSSDLLAKLSDGQLEGLKKSPKVQTSAKQELQELHNKNRHLRKNLIKRRLETLNMTRRELAQRLNLSYSGLSSALRSGHTSLETAIGIAEELGLSPAQVIAPSEEHLRADFACDPQLRRIADEGDVAALERIVLPNGQRLNTKQAIETLRLLRERCGD